MKVEAKKVSNGFLIPAIDELQTIRAEKVLLDVEIVVQDSLEFDEIDRFFASYQFDVAFDREEAHAR